MNAYRDTTDRDGVCEHARVEWLGIAGWVVAGLVAAAALVGVVA